MNGASWKMTQKEVNNEIIYRDLLRHLVETGQVTTVSKQFSALKTNSQRVDFVYDLLNAHILLPVLQTDEKDDSKALELRQRGNEMFKVKRNKEALDLYTKSLIQAKENSENIPLAFANRSAVLFEFGFYEECLMDIKRAFQYNYPEKLRWKLQARQENAEKLVSQKSQLHVKQLPIIPKELRSDQIECAGNAIEIKTTTNLGRHIVAKKEIQVGEILAIEKPFCHILINRLYDHCHECLKLGYSLIPCKNCTQVLYCSEECLHKAEYYHKYECKIMKTLRQLQLNKLKMLPLKIALVVKDLYDSIDDQRKVDENGGYCSSRYKEIHNLISNTEKRSVSDIFERSASSAVVYHLIKTYSSFFQTEKEECVFKELLLHHLQTAPSNFHEISELAENNDHVYELEEIGAGAFPFLSLFNHSCSPNVVRHCHGDVIVLRAIQTIKKGEKCNDNYGYHHALMDKHERQLKLKNQYYFDCSCEVCLNDWPLLQGLPTVETDIKIDDQDLLGLQRGDVDCAKRVLRNLLPRMSQLEVQKPNRNQCEMQEVLKQCFALFGNIRRSI